MSSFTQPLIVKHLPGNMWEVVEPFSYDVGYEGSGETIVVPPGFRTDFASVPRPLWWLYNPSGRWGKAAVIHDLLYCMAGISAYTRKESDAIFLEGMAVLGVRWTARVVGERAVDVGERLAESEVGSIIIRWRLMKYTGGNPARSARVLEIAGVVRERLSGEGQSATVAEVEELVRDEIDWEDMDEADRFAAREVFRLVFSELHEAVGEGLIEGDLRVSVAELIDLVEAGARLGAGGGA